MVPVFSFQNLFWDDSCFRRLYIFFGRSIAFHQCGRHRRFRLHSIKGDCTAGKKPQGPELHAISRKRAYILFSVAFAHAPLLNDPVFCPYWSAFPPWQGCSGHKNRLFPSSSSRIAFISASLRSKSNTSRFCSIRSLWVDLGITTTSD